MDSGVAALLGALIGGLATWASAYSVEIRRDNRRARSAAIAAAAEIEAAMALLHARQWRQGLQNFEDCARQGSVQQFSVHVADQYLPLTRAALNECGALDSQLTALMARLVMLESGLLSDLRRLAQFPVDHPGGFLSSEDPAFAGDLYAELGNLVEAIDAIANQAVQRVLQIYPHRKPTLRGRIKAAVSAFLGKPNP